jgi:hypothetical protein
VHDEVLGIVAHILPVPLVEDDLRRAALVDQVLEILGSEGRVAAEKRVSDDAHGPHVDWFPVAPLEHHFRRGVAEGARHGRENLVFPVKHLGNAEVGQDEVRIDILGEVKQVFGLQV